MYDKGAVTLCNLSRNLSRDFVATQVASEGVTCLATIKPRNIFSQEALHKVESSSTFRNDSLNAFWRHCTVTNIPFATCLAIFRLTSQ